MTKPSECFGCPLKERGTSFSLTEGLGSLGVGIIGEALGREEELDGLPLRPQGESGSLLERVFKLARLGRQQFLLDNVVRCRAPLNELEGQSWAPGAISHCQAAFAHRSIGKPQIKTLLALGGVAFQDLTGQAGEMKGIADMRGYVLPSPQYGKWVVGSYHPAYIRRDNTKYVSVLLADLRKAIKVASGEFRDFRGASEWREPAYQTFPSLDEAKSFLFRVRDNPNLTLSYDIETTESAVTEENERHKLGAQQLRLIQFSLEKRTGIAMPWEGEYVQIAKDILGSSNVKCGHNVWLFDNKVLANAKVRVAGRVDDTMWLFHHMQPDLDLALQKVASLANFPFPWKHLAGSDLQWYGCADVDACLWIMDAFVPQMKALDVWKGYESQVKDLRPVLALAENFGVGVAQDRRLEVKKWLEVEKEKRYRMIQEAVPDELRTLSPKEGYIRTPSEVRTLLDDYATAKAQYSGARQVVSYVNYVERKSKREIMDKNDDDGELVGSGCYYRFRLGSFEVAVKSKKPRKGSRTAETVVAARLFPTSPLDTESGTKQQVSRWVKVIDFNPNSSKQIVAYIKWRAATVQPRKLAKLYKVPLTLREGKETTAKKEIESLAASTGDKLFRAILEYRSYSKTLSNDIPNWEPNRDGRVHPEFGFRPATGQLNAVNPNVHNLSKHSEVGAKLRNMVVANLGEKNAGITAL